MAQKDLGDLISELRKRAKMTQQELAKRVNISDKAVSSWERGLTSPDKDIILKLAEILGTTADELLNAKLKEDGIKKIMYEFVNVKLEKKGVFSGAKNTCHQEVIISYANKGFRYAGYIPTLSESTGLVLEMDLIFEKPE